MLLQYSRPVNQGGGGRIFPVGWKVRLLTTDFAIHNMAYRAICIEQWALSAAEVGEGPGGPEGAEPHNTSTLKIPLV